MEIWGQGKKDREEGQGQRKLKWVVDFVLGR